MPTDERGRRISLSGECYCCGRRGRYVHDDQNYSCRLPPGPPGSYLFGSSPMLCGYCLASLRVVFNITEKDIAQAREQGFYRPASVAEQLDKALKHLDQAEVVTTGSRPRGPRVFGS